MDAVLGIISTISFVLAFACAVACVVIFFRFQVREAYRFLHGKSTAAPTLAAKDSRRDRSKKIAIGKKKAVKSADKKTVPTDEAIRRAAESPTKVAPGSEDDTSLLTSDSEAETGLLGTDSESETGLLGADTEAPTSLLNADTEAETGLLTTDSEKPTGLLANDSEDDTGFIAPDSEKPTCLLGADSEAPTGLLNVDSESPTGLLNADTDVETKVFDQADIPQTPPPAPVAGGDAPAEEAPKEVQGGVSIRDGDFFFVSKQHVLLVHTDEVIE